MARMHHVSTTKKTPALLLLLMRDGVIEDKVLEVVKLLLDHGAPPLQFNKQGKSAKSIARRKRFYNVIDLLEEYAIKPFREPELKWFISPNAVRRVPGVLGQGSFGMVYLAEWHHINVMVKEITVVEMRGFMREVTTWRELTHDNVVPLYGANHREEPYFIVSKYALNGELRKYLLSEKKKGRTVVWRKLKEVAAGLNCLHEQGIVHGDLKANNIVVSDNGTAMLMGFGLSFSEFGSCPLRNMREILGAMQWRAPEFANMTVETPTCKSDIFSLGMCIIEAVTCKTPWRGYRSYEIRECLRRGEIKVKMSREMIDKQWDLVKRMIAFSAGDRPDLDMTKLPALEEFALEEEMAERFKKAKQSRHCTIF